MEVAAASAARLRTIDPLLGTDVDGVPDGEHLTVGGAHGWAEVTDTDPASPFAMWGRLRAFTLGLRWDGEAAADVDALLSLFHGWALDHGSADPGDETQVGVAWPARDVAPSQAFLAHGLAPSVSVAVRPRGRALPPSALPDGVTVRRGTVDDAETVRAATEAEARYDSQHASSRYRPGYEDARRAEAREALATDRPWIWIAERDGAVAGVLVVQPPERAGWVSRSVAVDDPAYLELGWVADDDRGGGVGQALVAVAVAEVDAAGVPAAALHHINANPLSTPFWARMGWRPLWRYWQVWPAANLR